MQIKMYLATLLLCGVAIISQSIIAEEIDETSSSAFVMLGGDDLSNRSILLGLDIELKNFQHVGITFAQEQDPDKEHIAKRSEIRFGTNPYEVFSIETSLNSSNQTSDMKILNRDYVLTMKTSSLDSMANVNWNEWQFSAGAKLTNIETYYSDDNKINMHAKGARAEVSYYGFDNYFINASYYVSTASDAPLKSLIDRLSLSTTQLQTIIRQSIAYALLTTSPSIEARSLSFSVGRGFNRGSIGYAFIQSESIKMLDEALTSRMHMITGSLNLTETLELDILMTQQNDSENNTVLGANLGLTYHW